MTGSEGISFHAPDITCGVSVEDYEKGDANGDNEVDIADVVCYYQSRY